MNRKAYSVNVFFPEKIRFLTIDLKKCLEEPLLEKELESLLSIPLAFVVYLENNSNLI